jgi:hypothetical protein
MGKETLLLLLGVDGTLIFMARRETGLRSLMTLAVFKLRFSSE